MFYNVGHLVVVVAAAGVGLEGLRVEDVLFWKTRIGNRSGRIEIRFLEVPISGKVVEVLLLAVLVPMF
jgi:hypothetical protein